MLYFALESMAAVNPMYVFSLQSYSGVFSGALARAKFDAILHKRLTAIITTLTRNVYNYGCMGLFEQHNIMFSFQMTVKILESEGRLDRAELDFFLKGAIRFVVAVFPCVAVRRVSARA